MFSMFLTRISNFILIGCYILLFNLETIFYAQFKYTNLTFKYLINDIVINLRLS